MPSNHVILCCPLLLLPSIFPSIRVFSNESVLDIIGVSASASVLPMSIQEWFPLGWIGWSSSQSKGLSRSCRWLFNSSLQFWSSHGRRWMHILLLHNLVGPVCSLSLDGGGKCAAEVLSSKERMQPKGAGAPMLVPALEKCTPPSMPHQPIHHKSLLVWYYLSIEVHVYVQGVWLKFVNTWENTSMFMWGSECVLGSHKLKWA